jgi:exosortase D (VPLPA-CTERM-specific)
MPGNALGQSLIRDIRTKLSVLGVLFVAAYWIPLKGIVNTWMTNEDYAYGFIIPFLSAYLVWERRDALRRIPLRSSWKVLPLLIVFVAISVYSILGSSGNVSRPAIPFLVLLLLAFCFGTDLVRKILLPLAFLIFMIPVPDLLERTLGIYLKSISSELAGWFIRMFGFSVYVSGNVIDLGSNQLQVVDACNGLRYLLPLLALGVLYSHFFERERWKKGVCIAASIPIAILMNSLRIGVTGILTNYYGTKVSEGFMHAFSGWVVFVVSFIFLFATGKALSLLPSGRGNGIPSTGSLDSRKETASPGGGEVKGVTTAFLVSAALLIAVAGLTLRTKAMPAVTLEGGMSGFPQSFGGWNGKAEILDPETVRKSGAQEAFSGTYRDAEEKEVSLFLGYRSTAFLENENFFHSPTVCLPSAGWEVVKTGVRTIPGVPVFGDLKVSEMVVDSMGSKLLVYFWFQTKSRATHNKDVNRFHLSLHAIARDNTHDLFVRQITPVGNETIADAKKRMDGFAREMMVALDRFLNDAQIAHR